MYSHVQFLSFIPMLVFTELMRSIDRAIVRGEHSFTLAVEYQKSFLWDIYPEDNQAHIEKMRDAEYSLKKTLIITDQNLSNLLNI